MVDPATWAVVRREFVAFVGTRGFLIGTVFGPILISLFIVLPILFARGGGDRTVAIVDEAGVGDEVAAALAPEAIEVGGRYRVRVVAPPGGREDSVRTALRAEVRAGELDGFVWLPADVDAGGVVRYEGRHATSLRDLRELRAAVGRVVQEARLRAAGIDPAVLSEVLAPVELDARGLFEEEPRGAPDDLFLAAQLMAMALYLVILLYGNAILRGVREEKENRVVELVLSSIRPESLMAGKVFGVGAAGLLQVSIWVAFAALAIGFGDRVAGAIGGAVPEIPRVPWSAGVVFLLFFAGGYFLYAAIYAALGAMASSGQEAQNLQYPALVPLFVGFLMVFAILDDPGGALAVAGTLVPFTAPLVVPVRAAVAPIPWWEMTLSVGLLAATCWAFLWIGGRVYRVTILATGQRPSLARLWRWVREA